MAPDNKYIPHHHLFVATVALSPLPHNTPSPTRTIFILFKRKQELSFFSFYIFHFSAPSSAQSPFVLSFVPSYLLILPINFFCRCITPVPYFYFLINLRPLSPQLPSSHPRSTPMHSNLSLTEQKPGVFACRFGVQGLCLFSPQNRL